jgi:hypothetical protein
VPVSVPKERSQKAACVILVSLPSTPSLSPLPPLPSCLKPGYTSLINPPQTHTSERRKLNREIPPTLRLLRCVVSKCKHNSIDSEKKPEKIRNVLGEKRKTAASSLPTFDAAFTSTHLAAHPTLSMGESVR